MWYRQRPPYGSSPWHRPRRHGPSPARFGPYKKEIRGLGGVPAPCPLHCHVRKSRNIRQKTCAQRHPAPHIGSLGRLWWPGPLSIGLFSLVLIFLVVPINAFLFHDPFHFRSISDALRLLFYGQKPPLSSINFSDSSKVGIKLAHPLLVTTCAPLALAIRQALYRSHPCRSPYKKPPANASPAPSTLRTFIGKPGTSSREPSRE